jgi:SsrA-binding protein
MPRSLSNPTVAAQPKPAVKQKDRDPVAAGLRDAAYNRSASYNYALFDKFEAGVALRGTEVKSIREGKANLKDAYGLLKDGECFLLNAHIGPFSHGNAMNHESLRTRKLLLHRSEVRKLEGMTRQKGFTLIPTRLYFRAGAGQGQAGVGQARRGEEARRRQ